ncbi:MAG: Na-K-Cl cotransporter [Deltaproteobacteria bacterium]|nr:MAG: Na-K-Cl cotransporter [Deltaproteobacteria bacterium]
MAEGPEPRRKRSGFGTFAGVYTPTLLTILGVIMYLRQGWVIGNGGLVGGLLIIVLAFVITAATGLAMSSITTNIRIGAGGAYSIISQSLGLEVGGSVGIPLYLAQALAVTLYIFGFREGWLWVFPGHPALLIDLVVFAIIAGIAIRSAGLAFRLQYGILAIIGLSLVSLLPPVFFGTMSQSWGQVELWGTFSGHPQESPGVGFWGVFAVFFPAATGIMAGANMSGELRDPRRSILVGTLAAIATAFIVYVGLSFWLAFSAPTEELLSNYTVMIDRSAFGPAVLLGLLGATFSSALTSFVGAPRILQALGAHGVLPASPWLARRTQGGEPRNAILLTGAIVLGGILLRDLNVIAPLITLFFLITYAMINVVVTIEQSLGLVSFRPTFAIPRIISLIGAIGCIFAMFIINPGFSLFAVVLVLAAYTFMSRRHLDAPFGDVRSGLFVSIAEWAAKRVWDLSSRQERAWKPNLVVAVSEGGALEGLIAFLRNLAHPKGSIQLLGVCPPDGRETLVPALEGAAQGFRRQGVFSTWFVLEAESATLALLGGISAARAAFPRPNIVVLPLAERGAMSPDYDRLIVAADREGVGCVLLAPHPERGLGERQRINVWLHERSPGWELSMELGNLDLSLLLAYKLMMNWKAKIRVIVVVSDPDQIEPGQDWADELLTLARIPRAEILVQQGTFTQALKHAPPADLQIFGMPERLDIDAVHEQVELTGSACLIVRDSGGESALA